MCLRAVECPDGMCITLLEIHKVSKVACFAIAGVFSDLVLFSPVYLVLAKQERGDRDWIM